MLCPYCEHSDTKVIDSRDSGDGIRRRRECLGCDRRFTTYERVQMRSVMVVKRDGRREEFEREKLFASLAKACAKRPLPVGSIEKVLDEVEGRVTESGRAEVSSRAVGEMVMEKIKELDRVAYIRFASVYRDFRDIESFKEEIDALLQPREPEEGVHPDQIAMIPEDTLPSRDGRRRNRKLKRPQGSPA
jgi:transcriptional repressor NrdR